jgi:NAD(P)-dependent dehydrogenase (short-subunit alcohol dehydrogenase family)
MYAASYVQPQIKEHIMRRLENKTAVVTGGGTGIGLGAAKRFIEEGAFVYIFGRRQEALDAALKQLGPNARAVRGSVTDLADLDRLYATVKAERGGLDIVFANAGTGGLAALGAITPEQYDETFDINVKGTLFTVQKALPLLSAGASIILTGSSAGVMGQPQFSVYSATKAAIRNLARSWGARSQRHRHPRQCPFAGADENGTGDRGHGRGGDGRDGGHHADRTHGRSS